jgi:RNA polymerase sigma factor (sigma-70 family)
VTGSPKTRDDRRIKNAEKDMSADHVPGPETLRFLEEHFPQPVIDELQRYARALSGRQAGRVDASEAAIEGILKAAQFHRQLEDVTRLKSWVRTIVAREIYARLELAYHRRRRDWDDQALARVPADDAGSESELSKEWTDERLGHLLRRLPEGDRELVCLSFVQKIADAELARLYEISEPALRKRRSRAMQRLRELAGDDGSDTDEPGRVPRGRP